MIAIGVFLFFGATIQRSQRSSQSPGRRAPWKNLRPLGCGFPSFDHAMPEQPELNGPRTAVCIHEQIPGAEAGS